MDISELNRIESGEIKRHPWELARSKIIYTFIKKETSKYKVILDIGSGDSYLLKKLEEKNAADKYFAIDNAYSKTIILSLKRSLNDNVIEHKSSLDDIDKKFLPADCLLFLDVLEHCENDEEVLRFSTSEKFASETAVILITVPAFNSLFTDHDNLLKHYRRYNLHQLKTLCEKSGLHVKKNGYFFFSLLAIRSVQFLLEKAKLKKTTKSLDGWTHGKIITWLVFSFLWIDFRIGQLLNHTGVRLPGLSCFCICGKK